MELKGNMSNCISNFLSDIYFIVGENNTIMIFLSGHVVPQYSYYM